jgi:hypothetical protein
MIVCKELNKNFSSKEQMFAELKANKDTIINLKKSQIQKSCEKGSAIRLNTIKTDTVKGIELEKDSYYIAVNSTNFLDSHGDLHVKGIWNKTVKEQQRKNYLVTDHKMELSNVVARKENVEIFLADMTFQELGKNIEGNTEVLVYKVKKDDVINPLAKEWLESGNDIEASVRMQYVKVELALNSESKKDKEEKKVYDEYADQIANKSDFEEIDYFWVVKEAKNIGESSLVLAGSNSATGMITNNEPTKVTQDGNINEPTKVTQKDNLTMYNFI